MELGKLWSLCTLQEARRKSSLAFLQAIQGGKFGGEFPGLLGDTNKGPQILGNFGASFIRHIMSIHNSEAIFACKLHSCESTALKKVRTMARTLRVWAGMPQGIFGPRALCTLASEIVS